MRIKESLRQICVVGIFSVFYFPKKTIEMLMKLKYIVEKAKYIGTIACLDR